VVLGAAALTKLSGLLFLAIPILVLLGARERLAVLRQWPQWVLCYALAAAIDAPIFALGIGQYQVAAKSVVALEPAEMLPHTLSNLMTLAEWLAGYAPGLLLALIGAAALAALGLGRKSIPWLAGLLMPIVFFSVVSRVWYPRYVLMTAVPVAILVGWFGEQVLRGLMSWRRRGGAAVFAMVAVTCILPALQFDYGILVDPTAAPWPAIERWQYVANWPAGYGMPEAAQELDRLAAQSSDGINVFRMNKNSPVMEILDLYAWHNPRIALYKADFADDNPRPRMTSLAQQRPTYIIVDPPREGIVFGANYPRAQKVAEFNKPGGESAILIYQWP
jgi:hypothetical protein